MFHAVGQHRVPVSDDDRPAAHLPRCFGGVCAPRVGGRQATQHGRMMGHENSFSVAIIPYTYKNTNFNQINVGSKVNLEFDIIGKYISKMIKRID